MTYTGEVTPVDPRQSRALPGLTVTKLLVGGFGNNAYLLRCSRTGEAVLIDAAADAPALLREVDRSGGATWPGWSPRTSTGTTGVRSRR